MNQKHSLSILGAGAIGCYTGGWLARGDNSVTLIGRPRIIEDIRSSGLHLESVSGVRATLKSDSSSNGNLSLSTSSSSLSESRFILVCVKSAGTEEAAEQIRSHAPAGAVVVSLQNGLGAARILKEKLPGFTVLPGMVTFNVVYRGKGLFQQSTSGPIVIQDPGGEIADNLQKAFEGPGLELEFEKDMESVQWSKLLLNLNNGINALAGIPIRSMLSQRGYRRIIAACIQEAIDLYKVAGIRIVRLGKIVPQLAPFILRLPDFLFFRVASTMIRIDPSAMTSLAQDLMAGKKTEIDFLNGEIVRLARSRGREAPINESIVRLIHAAEQDGGGSPEWSPEELAGKMEL